MDVSNKNLGTILHNITKILKKKKFQLKSQKDDRKKAKKLLLDAFMEKKSDLQGEEKIQVKIAL